MKKHKSKWFYDLDITKSDAEDPILFVITEEMIQYWAESNGGRRLTDIEMNRVYWSFLEEDVVIHSRDSAMLDAVSNALDNRNNRWVGTDQDFKKEHGKK
jgi:hypothetical protein